MNDGAHPVSRWLLTSMVSLLVAGEPRGKASKLMPGGGSSRTQHLLSSILSAVRRGLPPASGQALEPAAGSLDFAIQRPMRLESTTLLRTLKTIECMSNPLADISCSFPTIHSLSSFLTFLSRSHLEMRLRYWRILHCLNC